MRMRIALRILIGLAAVALVAQTWLVGGFITPLVVTGGSMAPGLVGEHYHVVCGACGRSFDCGQESTPDGQRALCSSCGAWCELEPTEVKPGERLFVDRTAFLRGTPKRWDTVVCSLPDDTAALCVKRIVGLPGERITLSDGDLYADGQILRKEWEVLSDMAIVIDAADYSSKSDSAAPRWRPDFKGSRWRTTAEGFEIDNVAPSVDSVDPIDWISYHHDQIWRQGDRVARHAGPIVDDLAYNQNESRELVTVPDVILACQLQSAAEGDVYLRARDGRRQFIVRLDLAGRRGEVREGDRMTARFDLPGSVTFKRPSAVALALADCRLQLVVSGLPIVEYSYDPVDSAARQPTAEPLAIGAVGMPLHVTHWVVSRDIYYLPPPGKLVMEDRRLGLNEYWLLGDNTAVSDDSRTWPPHVRMTPEALVGRVLRWR